VDGRQSTEEDDMITVMGATGHTGREITTLLLAAGERVRVVGRSAQRLAELDGAEPAVGDAADAAFLTSAFDGADAVYTLLPIDPRSPDPRGDVNRLGAAIARALRDAGVRHVVALSSVGADLGSGTGFIADLHIHEQRLRALTGVNVLILRPGSFFENFASTLDLIRHEGVNGDSVAPDVPLPMIAVRDVAAVAAAALRARDWSGVVVRELLGERDLSYAEATRILGAALGRPDLPYVRFAEEDLVAALIGQGLSPAFAALQVEMNRAFSAGIVVSREGRGAANTTPTRFEDFAAELARGYAGAAPARS
jgi:uncharacterized protein YbjT (DUF2867 family)